MDYSGIARMMDRINTCLLYTSRELASQEMKNSAGATWDAATAGNAIGTWASSFGDSIDLVAVSYTHLLRFCRKFIAICKRM